MVLVWPTSAGAGVAAYVAARCAAVNTSVVAASSERTRLRAATTARAVGVLVGVASLACAWSTSANPRSAKAANANRRSARDPRTRSERGGSSHMTTNGGSLSRRLNERDHAHLLSEQPARARSSVMTTKDTALSASTHHLVALRRCEREGLADRGGRRARARWLHGDPASCRGPAERDRRISQRSAGRAQRRRRSAALQRPRCDTTHRQRLRRALGTRLEEPRRIATRDRPQPTDDHGLRGGPAPPHAECDDRRDPRRRPGQQGLLVWIRDIPLLLARRRVRDARHQRPRPRRVRARERAGRPVGRRRPLLLQ